ncbi:MAG: hypothetical protein HY209_00795, partial [Candidatus Omnitrophica bacterium]|nr:hypothetical protein [Candidatus Omnitrophota bacterium]
NITTSGNENESEGTKQFRQWAEPRRGTKVPETRPELAAKFGLSQGWIAQLLLEYKIETKTVWSTKVIKVKDTRPVLTSEERLRQDLGWETKILKEQAQEYWKEHRFAELSSGLTYVIAEEVSKMRDYYSQLMFNESVSAGGIVLKEVLDSYDPQKDGNSLIDYFRRQLKTRIPEILIFPRKSGHFKELVMEKDNSHNLRTISIGSENRLPFGQASGILISEPI